MVAEQVPWTTLNPMDFVMRLPRHGFSAAVALGVTAEFLPAIERLARMRFPLILHNRSLPWLKLPSIMRDDYHASQRIAELFYGYGHRRMCMICWARGESLFVPHGRIRGWLDFIEQRGLLASCTPPVCYANESYSLISQLEHMFRSRPRPTAIVFGGCDLAHAVMDLKELSDIHVPRDISVATFDSVVTTAANPEHVPLTEIVLDMTRCVECVIEMAERILGGELNPASIRMPIRIHQTDSIAAAKSADISASPVANAPRSSDAEQ